MVFCFIYTTFHDASVNPKTVAAYINYGDVNFNSVIRQLASHSLHKECPVFLSYGAFLYGLTVVVC
jgi:hypothetical protein